MKRSELRKMIQEEIQMLIEVEKPLEQLTSNLGKDILLKLKSQLDPVLKLAIKKGLISKYNTTINQLSKKNSFGNGYELKIELNEKDISNLFNKYKELYPQDESFIYESLFYLKELLIVTLPFFDNNVDRGVGGVLTLVSFRTPKELKKIRSGRPAGKDLKIKDKLEINSALNKYYKQTSDKIKQLENDLKNL